MSTAVQNGWSIASLDISMAFLKGLTFDEIREIKGGLKRLVSMRLPAGKAGEPSGSALLRTFPGYEDFQDSVEVLEMLKGGFGLVDAPNLFTQRADSVLKESGIMPTTVDPKVYVSHVNNKLVLHLSAHMDDFDSTGPQEQLDYLLSILSVLLIMT